MEIESFRIESENFEGIFAPTIYGFDLTLQCPSGREYYGIVKVRKQGEAAANDNSDPRTIWVDDLDLRKVVRGLEIMACNGLAHLYLRESDN